MNIAVVTVTAGLRMKKATHSGSAFRQTISGSDTRYGFHHRGDSEALYVFEGAVDLLSFLALYPQNWQQHSYLALDGVSSKPLHHVLKMYPIPKIDSAEVMFSAGRSRRVSIVAIVQSIAQLQKNYGKEGAEIIWDNTQLTIFGGFAPNSETAVTLSKNLGEQTILSGSISKGKGDGSQTLQMMGRPLITPDELKALPKGRFIVSKTGVNPMQATLRLFTQWGIALTENFSLPKVPPREVCYAEVAQLERAIRSRYAPEEYGDDDADYDETPSRSAIRKRTTKPQWKEDFS